MELSYKTIYILFHLNVISIKRYIIIDNVYWSKLTFYFSAKFEKGRVYKIS